MPVLVDGNNLLHAARDVEDPSRAPGRVALCATLARWAQRVGQRVHVVFDGPLPRGGLLDQFEQPQVQVTFSGAGVSADDVLIEQIRADSAARRLLVVSSDRVVRKAAQRRRATPLPAPEFWEQVVATLARPPRHSLEPPEKRAGLPPGHVEHWLSELGFEPPSDPPPPPRRD